MQQAMKQVLAGFAACGEAAGSVGTAGQTPLDGSTYRDVFVLDFFAGCDAVEIAAAGFL
jgi:hypothetical protein